MKKKIGVYICHCGGNISDHVDVKKVLEAIKDEEGVVLAKTTVFACADSNQKEMVKDIIDNKLDGIVVASCSPQLHLSTFRAVVERAGLNKYNYVHANIREQVSWAHSDDKPGANENAIRIVRAAIAKVRHARSLEPLKISSEKAVAVIGAGISGMKAAISLARTGSQVYLVERDHFPGGRILQWNELFSTEEKGSDLIAKLYEEIKQYENLKLFTGTRVVSQSGNIGNFHIKLEKDPVFIPDQVNESEITKAIQVCPVSVPDEFNFGLTERKAIFKAPSGLFTEKTYIDHTACTFCGECKKVCDSIDLNKKPEMIDIKVGAVVFATGFDTYTPQENEFGSGTIENVITLPTLKRLVSLSNGELNYNGKRIEKIAYIYCVGSRQPEGDNKYCSRYCCTAAIHTASSIRKKFRNITNYHFTRGVRTYGKQEAYYADALKNGDIFLQSADDELPQVFRSGTDTIVKINDLLTEKREVELKADLVVLITSMVPRADRSASDLFKLPNGRDNFLKEIHLKLRPVETVIDGITIAGTCQGPMNITESVNSALSASTKAYSYVSKGEIELEPVVAEVNKNICSWCDACTEACPIDAITKVKEGSKYVAVINSSICKACGMCLPVCPKDAIELTTCSNREIESMIDMLAMD